MLIVLGANSCLGFLLLVTTNLGKQEVLHVFGNVELRWITDGELNEAQMLEVITYYLVYLLVVASKLIGLVGF